jgi:hypothetical protein
LAGEFRIQSSGVGIRKMDEAIKNVGTASGHDTPHFLKEVSRFKTRKMLAPFCNF